MVDMPKNADSHIQKIAPGPPDASAVAQPVMLPVPTCAAIAVVSAWNELMPSWSAFLPFKLNEPNMRLKPAPRWRTCTKRVRMENSTPVSTRRYRSRLFHTKPLMSLTKTAS